MDIQEYFARKREIHDSILNFLDDDNQNVDENFESLISFLDEKEISKNRDELKIFLYLLSNVAKNHYRGQFFFQKIQHILKYYKKDIKQSFSNYEIFSIFQDSIRILLFLFQKDFIIFDQTIYNYFQKNLFFESFSTLAYFYKEIKSFYENEINDIKSFDKTDNLFFSNQIINEKDKCYSQQQRSNNLDKQYNKNIDHYDKKRKIGENFSTICKYIRKDMLNEFISYVNQNNVSLSSCIKKSIYETNYLLSIQQNVSLIEYAAFFGSVQIFKYLVLNKVKIPNSIWIYAIHGQNAEIIHLIEENNVDFDKLNDLELYKTVHQAISTHNNEIVQYILDNKIDQSNSSLYNLIIYSIFSSYNLSLLPDDVDIGKIFVSCCAFDYKDLVLPLLAKDKSLIESRMEIRYVFGKETPLYSALRNNKNEIVQILLSQSYTAIPNRLFTNFIKLTRINLPSSIRSIGDYSFEGCFFLQYVSIPSSVLSIGKYAFRRCRLLQNVTIPSSVTSIGYSAFADCCSLVEISISSSLTKIEFYTFENCSRLKQITIPSSLISIEKNAFVDCTSLTNVNWNPNPSVSLFGTCVFKDCSSLKEFVIPPFLKSIEMNTFQNCSSLCKVEIPPSVERIDDYAFNGCKSLTEVKFANDSSVKVFGNHSFIGCSSLQQISIPSSLNKIENNAFQDCSSLKQVTIPSSVISIGDLAFCGCSSLTNVSFEAPSSVSSIGKDIFDECLSLAQITIPPSLNIEQSILGLNVKVSILD